MISVLVIFRSQASYCRASVLGIHWADRLAAAASQAYSPCLRYSGAPPRHAS